MDGRALFALVLEAVGVLCLAAAGLVVHVALGLVVLGAGLVAFGLALERG